MEAKLVAAEEQIVSLKARVAALESGRGLGGGEWCADVGGGEGGSLEGKKELLETVSQTCCSIASLTRRIFTAT